MLARLLQVFYHNIVFFLIHVFVPCVSTGCNTVNNRLFCLVSECSRRNTRNTWSADVSLAG